MIRRHKTLYKTNNFTAHNHHNKHTNEGSSLLIMMIMGGGIISLIQGFVASDHILGIQYSYIVGVLCFAYLAFYAIKAKAILKAQGIDYDVKVSGGGH